MHASSKFIKVSNGLKLLPVILIFISTIVISYLYISSLENLFDKQSEQSIEKLYQKEKDILRQNVLIIANIIKHKKQTIEANIKSEIESKVNTAYFIAKNIYENNKDIKPKEEIQKEIIQTLRNLTYKNNDSNTTTYFFIQEIQDKENIIAKLLPASPQKEGTNRANIEDINGFKYIKQFYDISLNQKEGFVKYYWKKMKLHENESFPKLSFVKLFEPYNWMIGYGEYLNDIERRIKKETIELISNIHYIDNNYIFMYQLLDINGGEKFAKMLINPNKPKLVGKYISSKVKDSDGKLYREEFLNDLAKNGESFVEYSYKKLKSEDNDTAKKLSYFYHQKDWDWIIAQGVYLDKIFEKIQELKTQREEEKRNIIFRSAMLSLLFAIIASIITYFGVNAIRKMMIELTDKEIENYKVLSQQSKMASMGEMLENIAHQWRQPLTSISAIASSARVKDEMGIEESKEEYLNNFDTITLHAKYMSQTIEDFRNYFREDKSKTFFDISNAIEKSLMITNGFMKKYSITVYKDMEEAEFFGHENEFIQAIINILSNAKDAMNENNTEEKKIYISMNVTENNIIVSIEDNAGGIPNDILPNIFDQYFTTKDDHGTGIGLFMTKKIITESLGGKIEAKNTSNGACFIIDLKRLVE